VDRLAQQLALEVPQRDVERRERAGDRALGPELHELVEQGVEEDGVVERVPAQERGRHVPGDDDERGDAALHGGGLAEAEQAVVRDDADEGAARAFVRLAPEELERLDGGDLHRSHPVPFCVMIGERSADTLKNGSVGLGPLGGRPWLVRSTARRWRRGGDGIRMADPVEKHQEGDAAQLRSVDAHRRERRSSGERDRHFVEADHGIVGRNGEPARLQAYSTPSRSNPCSGRWPSCH
jgi:hypothetical protein